MGKGNNNQQRFQGASQQPQGQKNEQAQPDQAAVGGSVPGNTATQPATGAVQSSAGHAGTASTVTTTSTPALPPEGDGTGTEQPVAGSEIAEAPAVPDVVAGRTVAVTEEPTGRGSFGGVLKIIEESGLVSIPVAAAAISPYANGLLEGLQEYATVMNPRRPMTLSQGISYQRRLFRAIQAVINDLDGEDFEIVFGNFLAMIAKNETGAFNDLAVFRHLDVKELNLVPTDRRSFRDILNFLLKIAPLQSRAYVAKQVNLDATFAGTAFSEEGRQRVQNYCHIG